jgi:hypothetical protein
VDPKSEKAKRLKSLTLRVAIESLYLDICRERERDKERQRGREKQKREI